MKTKRWKPDEKSKTNMSICPTPFFGAMWELTNSYRDLPSQNTFCFDDSDKQIIRVQYARKEGEL
jgi:hypothetical protein